MKKQFYSDIVEIDSIFNESPVLDLSDEEKQELKSIAADHLHETIVDAVLGELSERDKKIFLANLLYDTHDKVWKHLKEKVENIEDKIKQAGDQLKAELRSDMKKVKSDEKAN